ncbi:Guanyl-specific ribonuclease Sa [Ephemeroptericola cinctiostellae]|uniref:Guanyl-specific ribonuclease Sa n=1 Tax=Ephemeroptericola cinctiostellae TaxID=2268024 RepID=A0A345D7Y5_9BURK|nr:Guanyl-specific ribonuclease Sa [Ephemeroptericola cinctiostellae]
MKRIHGLSAVLGMVFTLGLVGACNAWQASHNQTSTSSSSSMGAVFGGASTSSGRSQDSQSSGASSGSKGASTYANTGSTAGGDYATIRFRSLPPEAQEVIGKIKARSDFPYRQDGQVFSNREGVLPAQARGYYHEYTVITPGAGNRGARRVIAGSGTTGDVATAGEYYYTADHYRTFNRVTE